MAYRCMNPWCLDGYHATPTCPRQPPRVIEVPARPRTQREHDASDWLYRFSQAGELRILPRGWGWWLAVGIAFFLLLLIF